MKNCVVIMLLLSASVAIQAEEVKDQGEKKATGEVTREQYLKLSEQKAEARFAELDKNGDGVLSGDERKNKDKQKQEKKKAGDD